MTTTAPEAPTTESNEITITIIEELAAKLNEPEAPTEDVAARKLVTKIFETYPEQTTWGDEFTEDAAQYLAYAHKTKFKAKKALPLPNDFHTIVDSLKEKATAKEKASPERDPDEELIPHNMTCDQHRTTQDVGYLIDLLDRKELLTPDLQRNAGVWSTPTKELFIESLMSGVPIDPISIAIDPNSPTERNLLDGLQRATTLQEFKQDRIYLGGKEAGKKFSQLSETMQRKFLHCKIDVTEIKTLREWWPVIFRCKNKGGAPLNEHEIRRATWIHVSPVVQVLDALTKTDTWIELFGGNPRFKGLGALERAYFFHDEFARAEYKKPMKFFLDAQCARKDYLSMSKKDIKSLHENLSLVLESLKDRLGVTSYKLPESRSVNLGMVDLMIHGGLCFIEAGIDSIESLGEALVDLHQRLLRSDVVLELLNDDTSAAKNVAERFKLADQRIQKIIAKAE